MCGGRRRRHRHWGRTDTLTHTRAQDGETALMCAATRGHADCVRVLLDAGADKEAKNKVRLLFRVGVRLACVFRCRAFFI